MYLLYTNKSLLLYLILISEKWNETLSHAIPKHNKQPLKDIICMSTITKPRAVIQNIINKEQTGLDIANFLDDKYYQRKYGYHLCQCCNVEEWYHDYSDAAYQVYSTDDFHMLFYTLFDDYKKRCEEQFCD